MCWSGMRSEPDHLPISEKASGGIRLSYPSTNIFFEHTLHELAVLTGRFTLLKALLYILRPIPRLCRR